MTCGAEEQALAEIREQTRNAQERVQREKARAESALLRFNKSTYDWRAVRLAEALMECWNERCAQAEEALERCKKRAKTEGL